MAFPQPLEQLFDAYYAKELLPRMRVAVPVALLVMALFSLMDLAKVPGDVYVKLMAIRGVFAVLPLSLLWWATYQPQWESRLPVLGTLVCTMSGLTISTVLAIVGTTTGSPPKYEGLMLAMIFFYCCGGLRLRAACIAGMSVAVVYVLLEWYLNLSPNELMLRASSLAIVNLMGVASCAIMELSARRNFWMQRQLDALAGQDFLTGLLNRRALSEQMHTVWRQAQREHRPLNVALLDVDFFKRYNDHYGHPAGDEALRQVAKVLRKLTQRPLDMASRYGGEEFVCVWWGSSMQDVEYLLQSLHAEMAALHIAHAKSDVAPHLTVSAGLVHIPPGTVFTVEQALQRADEALYAAKAQGRNRAVVQVLDAA